MVIFKELFTVVVTKHVWPYFQSRFPPKKFRTCFFPGVFPLLRERECGNGPRTYSQSDPDGYEYTHLDEIVDHRRMDTAI